MTMLRHDLRYAVRQLAKRPGFTAVAVLTLALGIGASTALFTAVDALLLRPLPVYEPDRLIEVRAELEQFENVSAFSYPQYEALRENARSLAGLAASESQQVSFGAEAYAEVVSATFVSGNYFRVLGIRPALGRMIAPVDARRGSSAGGVVLSHGFWLHRFGGDSTVVGRTVELNGRPTAVIGVAPSDFTGTSITQAPELWAPLSLHERVVPNSRIFSASSFGLDAIGRRRRGVTQAQAQAELDALAARIGEDISGPIKLSGVELRELSRIPLAYEGGLERFVVLLLVATALVLLIATANVAGMLLVRATRRRREIAIRSALGAGRGRIVRQLLTEGVVLFLLGGAGGVLVAVWLTELLLAFRWPMPVTLDLGLDPRALGFALLLSLVTGVVFSLIPALRASRADVVPELKAGDGGGTRRTWVRRALVVGQVAMSLVLLVGAGLFLQALDRALSIDPGFDPEGVLVAPVDMHRQRYEEARGRLLYDRILERVRRVPGVEAASFSVAVPLGPGSEMLEVEPVGSEATRGDGGVFIDANVVSDGYFETLQIPLLRGRSFTGAGRPGGAPHVAIVNQTMAERFWPGENAIGKRFVKTLSAFQLVRGMEQSDAARYRVVGVVPDGRYQSLREEPEPHVFLPAARNYRSKMILSVRADDPGQVAAAVREAVQAVAPTLPRLNLDALEHLIGDALLPQRIGAILTGLFGLLGLLLTTVGIYGVMAFTVSLRTREIGIRRALGAETGSVLRLVLREGLALTLAGIALGLIAAFAATRFVSSLLYGVSATDPVTFAAVPLVLAAVALAATYLPARRAARVDPMTALRHE